MNNTFLEMPDEYLIDVNGGSWGGWATIFGGVAFAFGAVVAVAAAPVLSTGAALALGVTFMCGQTAAAMGMAEVVGAIKF